MKQMNYMKRSHLGTFQAAPSKVNSALHHEWLTVPSL
jgi:hypothetical protein